MFLDLEPRTQLLSIHFQHPIYNIYPLPYLRQSSRPRNNPSLLKDFVSSAVHPDIDKIAVLLEKGRYSNEKRTSKATTSLRTPYTYPFIKSSSFNESYISFWQI